MCKTYKKIYEVYPLICPIWGVFDKNTVLKAFSAKTLPILIVWIIYTDHVTTASNFHLLPI